MEKMEKREKMEYLVIGAGGTGGCIAAYLAEAGKDVTLIARGEHLEAIKTGGLLMETTHRGSYRVPLKACAAEAYRGRPGVIFICVKSYSLGDVVPFLRRAAGPDTVILPILNGYGIGEALQKELPGLCVLDGCIYISASKGGPGTVCMYGDLFRVVFGRRDQGEGEKEEKKVLEELAEDLRSAGIKAVLSENIRRDCYRKFAFISVFAAAGAYYHATAGDLQKPGEGRDTFVALSREIAALGDALGLRFEDSLEAENLKILDASAPAITSSYQRDLAKGGPTEAETLIREPVKLGRRYGVPTPTYERVAQNN